MCDRDISSHSITVPSKKEPKKITPKLLFSLTCEDYVSKRRIAYALTPQLALFGV